jgi:hypothetical protein
MEEICWSKERRWRPPRFENNRKSAKDCHGSSVVVWDHTIRGIFGDGQAVACNKSRGESASYFSKLAI